MRARGHLLLHSMICTFIHLFSFNLTTQFYITFLTLNEDLLNYQETWKCNSERSNNCYRNTQQVEQYARETSAMCSFFTDHFYKTPIKKKLKPWEYPHLLADLTAHINVLLEKILFFHGWIKRNEKRTGAQVILSIHARTNRTMSVLLRVNIKRQK